MRIRLTLKIALFLGILIFLNYALGWLANLVAFQLWPRQANMALYILGGSVALYILTLAIPFLPGLEIGIMIMMMLGRPGIVVAYICTVIALSLSFLFGRLLPPPYHSQCTGLVPSQTSPRPRNSS
jgi:hypothetical protein